jgi:antirestriction protein ArdC
MASLKEMYMLYERVDYIDIAEVIVKLYKLKSKVIISRGSNKAEYNMDTDTIIIRPSYKSIKDFIITVLHEINHAMDASKLGKSKYKRAYELAGSYAIADGGDFHDDNKFEKKAEKWAHSEFKKQYISDLIKKL